MVSYCAILIFLDDRASLFNRLATTTRDLQLGSAASMLALLSFRYFDFDGAIPTKSAPNDFANSLTADSNGILYHLLSHIVRIG